MTENDTARPGEFYVDIDGDIYYINIRRGIVLKPAVRAINWCAGCRWERDPNCTCHGGRGFEAKGEEK